MIDLAPIEPDRNAWCTPKAWADAVGVWDLDPCSNARSHIQARYRCALEWGSNGLEHEGDEDHAGCFTGYEFAPTGGTVGTVTTCARKDWRVWLNPPYGRGEVLRWLRHYKHTRFCFLVRLDPSTEWFAELIAASEVLMVPRGERIEFEAPPGARVSKNPFPHVLAYADHRDVTPAVEALCFEWRVI